MSPAQSRIKRNKRKNRKSSNLFNKWLFILLLIIGVFVLFLLTTKYWSKDAALSVVFPQKNGDVEIATFNPNDDSISTITIPAETQVRVARQLGTWRIKSVWKLGQKEKMEGQLLAETVTREFGVPVYAWADTEFGGFAKPDPISVVKATISFYKTNIGLGDRLRLALFSVGIKNFKRSDVNLKDTRFLTKKVLVDGGEGYVLKDTLSGSLLAEFYDARLAKGNTKIKIIDDTGNSGIAEDVGRIAEVVGLKVASIQKEQESNVDCQISGNNDYAVKKMAILFACDKKNLGSENFDVVMRLGTKFTKRY